MGFFARPEGSTFTVPNSSGGNTTFFITYKGGDGNDVALHVPSTIPPSNDLESAIVRTLAPAAYTAIVRGVNETTGIALVEVYALE